MAIETIERKLVLNPKVSHLARFLGLFAGSDWSVAVRPPKLNYGTSTTGMAGGVKRKYFGGIVAGLFYLFCLLSIIYSGIIDERR